MSCMLLPGATSENWRAASPPEGTTLTVTTLTETEKVCGMKEKKKKYNQFNREEDCLVYKDYF